MTLKRISVRSEPSGELVTQTQLHVLTRLRLAEDLLARLEKAHSVKDYVDLRDFTARVKSRTARDAEMASFAVRIERAAEELLQRNRKRVPH